MARPCQSSDPSSGYSAWGTDLKTFDARMLGASLQEVGIDVIRGEQTDLTSRWFHTPANSKFEADLVIWADGEKRIIKQQLCFFGQIVEWSAMFGTRTGFVKEVEVLNEAEAIDASEIIHYDTKAQASVVLQGLEILSGVLALSESHRKELSFRLRQSPKLHKNALQRALAAWEPALEQIRSQKRPGILRRLSNWLLGE